MLDFNSIKVRLELSFKRVNAAVCKFQFHKGTIRTKQHKDSVAKMEDFNSIKVRLEHKMREYSNFYAALFQFHKGTIRTSINRTNKEFIIIFQFHKGTIRTDKMIMLQIFIRISIP